MSELDLSFMGPVFPFRVDPFSSGALCAGKTNAGGQKSCLLCKTRQKILTVSLKFENEYGMEYEHLW